MENKANTMITRSPTQTPTYNYCQILGDRVSIIDWLFCLIFIAAGVSVIHLLL